MVHHAESRRSADPPKLDRKRRAKNGALAGEPILPFGFTQFTMAFNRVSRALAVKRSFGCPGALSRQPEERPGIKVRHVPRFPMPIVWANTKSSRIRTWKKRQMSRLQTGFYSGGYGGG